VHPDDPHNPGTWVPTYDSTVLILFCFVYFVLAVITYGMAVPSGLFVPCILIGASMGRVVGQVHLPNPACASCVPLKAYGVACATALAGDQRLDASRAGHVRPHRRRINAGRGDTHDDLADSYSGRDHQ